MNYIHPSAVIYDGVKLGNNVYIGANCVIGAPPEHRKYWDQDREDGPTVIIGNNVRITSLVTVDGGTETATIIQDNCLLLAHSHIGHDAIIFEGSTISCGAKIGGHAQVGPGANVGLNATVHQRQKIARGAMIGMSAAVTKKLETKPFETYAGNPAKFIKANTQHPEYTIYMEDMLKPFGHNEI